MVKFCYVAMLSLLVGLFVCSGLLFYKWLLIFMLINGYC